MLAHFFRLTSPILRPRATFRSRFTGASKKHQLVSVPADRWCFRLFLKHHPRDPFALDHRKVEDAGRLSRCGQSGSEERGLPSDRREGSTEQRRLFFPGRNPAPDSGSVRKMARVEHGEVSIPTRAMAGSPATPGGWHLPPRVSTRRVRFALGTTRPPNQRDCSSPALPHGLPAFTRSRGPVVLVAVLFCPGWRHRQTTRNTTDDFGDLHF